MNTGGFALATVVLLLALIGLTVFLVTREASTGNDRAVMEHEAAVAALAARAGFAHARWVANNSTCANYALPTTQFGTGSYAATFTPDSDSPVTVTVSGTTATGASALLVQQSVRVYEAGSTLVLQPGAAGEDAEIWDQAPNNNYGDSAETWVSSASNDTTRSLLRFDLGGIPNVAKVLSATLSLHRQSGSGSNQPISAHRIINQWSEATVSWNERESGTNWDTAGGDFESFAHATTPVGPSNGRYEWDITSLAQGWVDGRYANYGVALVAGVAGMTGHRFHTSDDTFATKRPSLSVTYACECGVVCIGAASDKLILSTDSPATLGGLSFDDIDLVEYDPATATAQLFLEGGLTSLVSDISALHVLANGRVLMATKDDATLGGLGFEDADLVEYAPGVDVATLFFDGSDHFDDPTEEITSVHLLDNGNLVLSTDSPAVLGGLSFSDKDLVEYNPADRSASIYFDGDATSLDQDIAGVHIVEDGVVILAAEEDTSLGGLSFKAADLVRYDIATDQATMHFEGSAAFSNSNEKVRSVHVGDGTGTTGANSIVLATMGSATLGGLTFTDKDLVEYFPSVDRAGLLLDGAALGLAQDLDAAHVLENGHIVLSAINTITLGGVTAENEDLLVYDRFEDSATMLFDGSTVFTGGSTDISGVHVLDNGNLLLTNEYPAVLGGLAFLPSDIIEYDPVADTATKFLDGVAFGIFEWINAVSLLSNGKVVVSFDDEVTLSGTDFSADDLIELNLNTGAAKLFFDGELFSDDENVRAAHVSGSVARGPIAHWMLDEGSGNTALDSEGGHDGTLNNNPTWVGGQDGDALEFDGNDDYVDLTSDAELDDVFDGGATVMAWIYPTGWGENGYGRVFDKSSSPSSTGDGWAIRMNVDNGGIINFGQGFSGGRGWWRIPNGSISLNTWQHIAVVYDSSSAANDPAIYLDGAPLTVMEIDSPSGSLRSDAAIDLRLGNFAGGTSHTFDGTIDDARIYDWMLDAGEIAEVHAATSGGGGGGPTCTATIADDFETDDYTGNTGTLDWNGVWFEVNEGNGPNSGDEQVVLRDGADLVARVRDNDGGGEGILRSADLSGFTSAVLSFEYWRGGLDDANDYVAIEAWPNGTGHWEEVFRIAGPGSDDSSDPPHIGSADVTAFIMNDTHFRFVTSPNMGGSDAVFLDDIEICLN